MKKRLLIYFAVLSIVGCNKYEIVLPSIETVSMEFVTHNSVKVNIRLTDDGSNYVFDKGVVIARHEAPSVEDRVFSSKTDEREISVAGFDLEAGTKYYVRAYAISNDTIGYGEILSFVTSNVDYFDDSRDGNIYPIIEIGEQQWMGENLRYKSSNSFNPPNAEEYGNLGQLYSYADIENICPLGWHLPSDDEWKILEGHIGLSSSELDQTEMRGIMAGNQLKYPNDELWLSGSEFVTNEFGFSALPAGLVTKEGEYANWGLGAFFWTSTGQGDSQWCRFLKGSEKGIGRELQKRTCLCSVRCVKD